MELEPAGKAMDQLMERRYWEQYEQKAKEIYAIGVEFSKEDRNIVNFEWKRVM